ncbi:hypothetical protein [Streptomyces sp. NPDC048295]|uniref:hypothetical protein n=1 Tax=Streptomyces sp. NPDC048295 TaxID=3154617 RepID=UPI003416FE38
MTKNGSNTHKHRIRAHAAKTGSTYRQAAEHLSQQQSQEEKEHAEHLARRRALIHDSETLSDEREYYLERMLAADLPGPVRACLFVLADHLGTGNLIDTRGVNVNHSELVQLTGLAPLAVEEALNLGRAHGWITGNFTGGHVRLSVPGEEIQMYEWFLTRITRPVADADVHARVLARINAELADQAQERAYAQNVVENFIAGWTT